MKKFIIYLLKPFSFRLLLAEPGQPSAPQGLHHPDGDPVLFQQLHFLPALLVMYMIFTFSSQTGVDSGNLSYKISYHIVSAADQILEKNLSEADKETLPGRNYPR